MKVYRTGYKFIKEGLKSQADESLWELGVWRTQKGKLALCKNGFHFSDSPLDALNYVQSEFLALVEVDGKILSQEDKSCAAKMRLTKVVKFEQKDFVEMAIFAAELVLDNFEKEYPKDDRPRKAIEAAKEWVKNPSAASYAASAAASDASYAASAAASDASDARADASDARAAASAAASYAASAASAASDAASYARGARGAASDAASYARGARGAASAAASYAASAASAASDAASYASYARAAASYASDASYASYASAASAEIKAKINNWMLERIKTLEEVK